MNPSKSVPYRRIYLHVVITILLAALAGMLILPVFAQGSGDPDDARPGEVITGIVEFEGSRVYPGPDFAYPVIGELAINTSVTILGRRGDFFYAWTGDQWLEIAWGTESAWVYARLIRTSIPFNSIFPTGRRLPRNPEGRVPTDFDLSDDICDSWTGEFTRVGDFMNGDLELTVTYPALTGATVYSVIVISPFGERRAFDSTTTSAVVVLDDLPRGGGIYTWRVAPYYSYTNNRSEWQQICLLQTGGTFEAPGSPATPRPTRRFSFYGYVGPTFTPQPTPTNVPFVP